MTDIIMLSGGLGSWMAGILRRRSHPQNDVQLVFADTRYEDADLYRFLPQAAASILGLPCGEDEEPVRWPIRWAKDIPDKNSKERVLAIELCQSSCREHLPQLNWLADGRTIWQVFRDARFLGNSRVDPCSKILKRQLIDKWRATWAVPETSVNIIGYGPEEGDRVDKAKRFWADKGWSVAFPCFEAGIQSYHIREELDRYDIRLPRLYEMGFEHNNCRGGCVKAGIGAFVSLFQQDRGVFDEWKQGEEEMRELVGQNVSILTDRRGGERIPMTLATLQTRIESGEQFPTAKRFACGCFSTDENQS